MNASNQDRTIRRRIAIGWLPILLLFVLGGSMAGCGGKLAPAPAGGGTATGGHTMNHPMPTSTEVDAAMAGSPGFVRSSGPRTEEAYAFAIARPDVVDWLPCYCGCVEMDHRNNGDCFMKPRSAGMPIVFEEHASYCDICVDIALKAKSMLADGRTVIQIRAAVDGEFGGAGPGTNTDLPPS